MVSEVLKLDRPPSIPDIPTLCNKAIATILSKTNKQFMDSIRKKEDALYKKSPKRYHTNFQTAAGLQPCAKDQPNLTTIIDPNTGQITSHPQTILDTLHTHFEKEQSRVTPDTLPIPPWLDPNNPNTYTTPKQNPSDMKQLSLDQHLTRSHYNTAYQRAP